MKGIGFSFDADRSFFHNPLVFVAGFSSMFTIIMAMAAYIYYNFEDLDKVTDALTLLLQGATSGFKAIAFVCFRKRFRSMYYKLSYVNKTAKMHFKSSADNIKSFNDKAIYISTVYVWSCFIAGSTAQLIPFVKSIIMYFGNGDSFEKVLPYLAA